MSDLHIPANPAEAYRGFKAQDNLKRIVPDTRNQSYFKAMG
jgi:hypothetical protein